MGTDAWGIDDGWHDTTGGWHPTSPAVRDALRGAMGGDARHDHPPAGRDVWVIRPGEPARVPMPRELLLEDGSSAGVIEELPADLPIGIHELLPADDDDLGVTLLVSPGHCHLPPDTHGWGVAMQVPVSRSTTSWGIGDLGDIGTVARWVAQRGGTALGLSPLHAATPVPPLPASPYSPSSRRWHNPALLCVDAVPGAADLPDLQRHAKAARGLLTAPLVDRDAAWEAKVAALEILWDQRSDRVRDEVAAFEAEQGRPLELWTTFCTLAELHGPDWWAWPEDLRHPDRLEAAAAVEPLRDRLAFHAWLQLLLRRQLDEIAGHGVRLIQDLAIGVDPHGADAWSLQDLLALGVSVGAPPDDFEPQGQVWGLPPFIPWRLRDAGYRPLAELLRVGMRGGGGLRIDHVMGLSRLFWVPEGMDPKDASYVRFAGRELLEVLAIESARSGAVVVGEDLGTVEDQLRAELAATKVLSTRLVWFEDEPPEHYPAQSLGMVTTHDLPTVSGLWTGADGQELEELGRPAPPEATEEVLRRVERLTGLDPRARQAGDVPSVLETVHRRLGSGSSMLVLATLEDATAAVARPNVPGTTTERPNWSVALSTFVDELDESPTAPLVVDALREGRRQASRGD